MKIGKRRYAIGKTRRCRWPLFAALIGIALLGLFVAGAFFARGYYNSNLEPVSSTSNETKEIVIKSGALAPAIAKQLHAAGLIKNEPVFLWFVKTKGASDKILAGTYRLQPNLSTPEIVNIITKGKVATDLFTILPGQRLDEIRESLIKAGFSADDVDRALLPQTYLNNPALVDNPNATSLEGYLYPESFQKSSITQPEDIVRGSLKEMQDALTPDIRAAFASKGLSVYQGIILASIVQREAYRQDDRDKVAQVFLSRLARGMRLESNPTADYGAIIAGATPSILYSSPWNTYEINGLPPTPISNVNMSALQAVANPASTDYLYFVAGDDGTTHFSHTLQEHEALTRQYCTILCGN